MGDEFVTESKAGSNLIKLHGKFASRALPSMATPEAIFRTFTRLWICTESVLHVVQQFLVPHELWLYVQAVLFIAAFAHPSRFVV